MGLKTLGSVTLKEVFDECNNGIHDKVGCEGCPFLLLRKKNSALCEFAYRSKKEILDEMVDIKGGKQ